LTEGSGSFPSSSFDYVPEVEVYDIEKNLWKVLNYISDTSKLTILYPGAT